MPTFPWPSASLQVVYKVKCCHQCGSGVNKSQSKALSAAYTQADCIYTLNIYISIYACDGWSVTFVNMYVYVCVCI